MAISLSETITINRPIKEVFAHLSDPRRMAQVGSGVSRIEHVSGPKVGLGAKYRTYGTILGRNTDAQMEIIEFDPPRAITMRGTFGRVAFEDHLTLKSIPGGTELTLHDSSSPWGLFKAFSFIYKQVVAYYTRRDLARMKQVIESQK